MKAPERRLFKVNNKNTRKKKICPKLTIKTPERRHRQYFTPFSSVSIADFEQVNVSWLRSHFAQYKINKKQSARSIL